mmetsp:Transcript_20019/g.55616  ORF Transcript_20019/g.55616 Transcript_20019/m.55616 type:complete len:214 (+) Transcript_20019:1573-2214(+)
MPSSSDSSDTSKVPPPRSNTITLRSSASSPPPPQRTPFCMLSKPYATAAAVGSLMMRSTSSPAIVPASLVAWRCESLKYAGTVTTALVMVVPRYASAVSLIFARIMLLISSAQKVCVEPLYSTSISGLSLSPASTTKGHSSMSCCTQASLNLRPMSRLASKMVLTGLVEAWLRAPSPTRRSCSVKPTTEGVIRLPWSLAMISTRPFCHTPTQL